MFTLRMCSLPESIFIFSSFFFFHFARWAAEPAPWLFVRNIIILYTGAITIAIILAPVFARRIPERTLRLYMCALIISALQHSEQRARLT